MRMMRHRILVKHEGDIWKEMAARRRDFLETFEIF